MDSAIATRLTAARPDAATDRPRIQYQPALDGIRGVAVAGVLVYHGNTAWLAGGYLGVDAFFVLSGYLITSLLVAEWRARGTIRLGSFWVRRARRLFPALFLVLAAVLLYAKWFAPADQLSALRYDLVATLGYFANWRAIFTGHAYMDQFAVPSPLMHTWSLAIEEQWYVVWPLLLLAMLRLRRVGLRGALVVSLLLAGASAGWMAWLQRTSGDVSRAYYGTDTRAQSLLIGAAVALAFALHPTIRSYAAQVAVRVVAAAGVGVTAWLWWSAAQTSHTLYRGGFLLASTAVAAVIVSVVQPDPGLLGKVLSTAPLRWIGRISYGLYLWHWPLYVLLTPQRVGFGGVPLFVLRAGSSVAAAALSFYLVERPVRRGALRIDWRGIPLAPLVVAGTASVLVVGAVVTTEGAQASAVLTVKGACNATHPSGEARVMVLGDSVAATVAGGLTDECDAGLSVASRAVPGCGLLRAPSAFGGHLTDVPEVCRRWPQSWPALVDTLHPTVVMIHTATWDMLDRYVNDRWLQTGTKPWNDYVQSELNLAVGTLAGHGAAIALLTAPYFHVRDGLDVPRVSHSQYNPRVVAAYNNDLRAVARRYPGVVTMIDLNRFACPHGKYTNRLHGVKNFRPDGVHFSPAGARLVGRWLAPKLIAIKARG